MDANPDPQTANLARTRVIRADPRDPLVIPVNISAMLDGNGDSTDNIQLRERDIIYVPPTMIAELGYFLARNLPVLKEEANFCFELGHSQPAGGLQTRFTPHSLAGEVFFVDP